MRTKHFVMTLWNWVWRPQCHLALLLWVCNAFRKIIVLELATYSDELIRHCYHSWLYIDLTMTCTRLIFTLILQGQAIHDHMNTIWHFLVTLLVSVTIVMTLVRRRRTAWTFSHFLLLLKNCCKDFFQIWYGCSPGGCLPSLLKSGCYPYFLRNYG